MGTFSWVSSAFFFDDRSNLMKSTWGSNVPKLRMSSSSSAISEPATDVGEDRVADFVAANAGEDAVEDASGALCCSYISILFSSTVTILSIYVNIP